MRNDVKYNLLSDNDLFFQFSRRNKSPQQSKQFTCKEIISDRRESLYAQEIYFEIIWNPCYGEFTGVNVKELKCSLSMVY